MASSFFENDGFTFVWKIENATCSVWNEVEVESPTFVVGALNRSEWFLKFQTFDSLNFRKHFNCFLYRASSGPDHTNVVYTLSIHGADGSLKLQKNRVFKANKDSYSAFENYEVRESYSEFSNINCGWKDVWTVRCRMWDCIGKISSTECYAKTIFSTHRKIFTLKINNFSIYQLKERKETISMPSTMQKESFDILISENQNNAPGDILEIHIRCAEEFNLPDDPFIYCKISILDKQGVPRNAREISFSYDHNQLCKLPLMSKRQLVAEKSLYLPNDILSLQFDFRTYGDVIYSEIAESVFSTTELKQEDSLKEDLRNLYKERKFCDVILRAECRTFEAHKTILSARSEVFATMFQVDMQEKNRNVVDIADVDADTLDRMLLFLYSQTLDNMKMENAQKLYAAANKYNIPSLKKECADFMKSKVSRENVTEIMALAEMHDDFALKAAIQNLIYFSHD